MSITDQRGLYRLVSRKFVNSNLHSFGKQRFHPHPPLYAYIMLSVITRIIVDSTFDSESMYFKKGTWHVPTSVWSHSDRTPLKMEYFVPKLGWLVSSIGCSQWQVVIVKACQRAPRAMMSVWSISYVIIRHGINHHLSFRQRRTRHQVLFELYVKPLGKTHKHT